MGLAVSVAVCLTVCLLIFGTEMVYRLRETYIVPAGQGGKHFLRVVQDPDYLIRYTPHGRRLRPWVQAVIQNHYLSHKDVLIETNAYGFRDHEIPAQKAANEIRVLALGDSITWGDYLQADEVYEERAERILQERFPDRKIEVINAGVGDIGLDEEIDILKEQGLNTDPDVVLVGLYLNDSRPPWGFPSELGERGWWRRHSVLIESVWRQLRLRGWLREQGADRFLWIPAAGRLQWRTSEKDFRELVHLARYDWGAAWEGSYGEALADRLAELRSLSTAHGFKVMVVQFPVVFQVYADFLDNTPQESVQEETRSLGIDCYDLLPLLRSHRNRRLFFDQCHPNEYANDLIGRAVAEQLANVLPGTGGPSAPGAS
jgi:lysophospholipase L1-like esterase